jgi:hypothetical protein
MKRQLYEAARAAGPNAPWHGYPPLHAVIQLAPDTPSVITPSHLASILLLLEHGADRFRKNKPGHTPAGAAQISGRPQLRILLK